MLVRFSSDRHANLAAHLLDGLYLGNGQAALETSQWLQTDCDGGEGGRMSEEGSEQEVGERAETALETMSPPFGRGRARRNTEEGTGFYPIEKTHVLLEESEESVDFCLWMLAEGMLFLFSIVCSFFALPCVV